MRKRLALLTPGEAAEILNVSTRTMYRWVQGNRIPFIRLPGGDVRINEDELLAWLDERHHRVV